MKIKVLIERNYYVTAGYMRHDAETGTQAGWYAYIAERPEDQADFVMGPFLSESDTYKAADGRLRGGYRRPHGECQQCFEPIPPMWPTGERRGFCDDCLGRDVNTEAAVARSSKEAG